MGDDKHFEDRLIRHAEQIQRDSEQRILDKAKEQSLEQIESLTKKYKRYAMISVAALVFSLTLGFLPKETIYRTVIKAIYPDDEIYSDIKGHFEGDGVFSAAVKKALPPEDIYDAIKPQFENDAVFTAAVKKSYPTTEIYSNVKVLFLQDNQFNELLFNDETLDSFPRIRNEIPGEVWQTVKEGKAADYKQMLENPGFYRALAEYHQDLIKRFVQPNSNRQALIAQIMELGRIPANVKILMPEEAANNTQTKRCRRMFSHESKMAILVIPETFAEQDYSWFDCKYGHPKIGIRIDSLGESLDNVQIVEVRRMGNSPVIRLLVSKKVAEGLKLPGASEFAANAPGEILITSAK
ncbi:hypothetical protein [Zobellella maritima]|uniref:hypothetical protein n=1 Tax=Zobellella maritima TaxID=2059725 RepID=UPI000E308A44|nr:hypothetical protein [Zobellella maritima]